VSIALEHVSKTFGRFTALRDVSLTVRSGELLALLGPSGSGKTTLLRIIAGLEQPDAGSGPIRLGDADVAGRPVGDRRVGFVFQHYALFRHLTVFENVAFGLRVRPRPSRPGRAVIADRVTELLRLVQLESLAGRYPHQLSGGQRQRVALARALAIAPRVLLLDEPFGALDARVRQQLRQWLRGLHDELNVTTVLVTHDQDEALEVADRVVVMHDGGIEQVGTPDEVFHDPRTEFVMEFLGSVNRLDGLDTQGPAPVYVRPHAVDLHVAATRPGSIPAVVRRVHSAGPLVRVELLADSGRPIHAELSHDRCRALALAPGQTVFVTPREVKVFGVDPHFEGMA
jgi:sulfate transport system ATP-binding protein